MADTTSARHGTSDGRLEPLMRWGGIAFHLGIAVFPLSASGLMAPPWAIAVIATVWVLALAGAWRLGQLRPRFTPLVPAVTLAAWFAFMTAGDLWFGWVA